MIKYLQSKKGFTMVELIVVIAILGVMMAIILPNINTRKARISEARSTATDFYAACQSVFSKLSMFEGALSPKYKAEDADHVALGIMGYFRSLGGNYPIIPGAALNDDSVPTTTDIYLELHARGDRIESINVKAATESQGDEYFYGFAKFLQSRTANQNAEWNKEFSRMMSEELEDRIKYQDGYYYAKIGFTAPPLPLTITERQMADTVKVKWTAYTRDRLPEISGGAADYENANLMFGDDFVLPGGEVCGTCAAWNDSAGNFVGLAGTTLK